MVRKLASKLFLVLSFLNMFFAIGAVSAEEPTVCVVYFTKVGCPHCAEVDIIIFAFVTEYGSRFVVLEYEIPQNAAILLDYSMTYGFEVGVPLVIFGHGDFLYADSLNSTSLKSRIDAHLTSGNELPLKDGSSVAFEDLNVESLPGTFRILPSNEGFGLPTILMVITAAVVDSINPCAFAVLVILLSGIIASGGKKKALKAGLAFIFAVFVIYLLIGFGIFYISMAPEIAIYFPKAVGVFALIVGVLNMKDYFWASARGFLSSVPVSWRPRVQKLLDEATSVPGALISGIVVSLFLLPCSSGPYLSALGLLAHETTRTLATVLILLYNFVFILPMIGIVLAVYFGLTSTAKAAHWRHKRIRLLHLIAGVLMFCMGIWMLFFY